MELVLQVMKARFDLVALIAQNATVFGKRSAACVVPGLVDKLADVKVTSLFLCMSVCADYVIVDYAHKFTIEIESDSQVSSILHVSVSLHVLKGTSVILKCLCSLWGTVSPDLRFKWFLLQSCMTFVCVMSLYFLQ